MVENFHAPLSAIDRTREKTSNDIELNLMNQKDVPGIYGTLHSTIEINIFSSIAHVI